MIASDAHWLRVHCHRRVASQIARRRCLRSNSSSGSPGCASSATRARSTSRCSVGSRRSSRSSNRSRSMCSDQRPPGAQPAAARLEVHMAQWRDCDGPAVAACGCALGPWHTFRSERRAPVIKRKNGKKGCNRLSTVASESYFDVRRHSPKSRLASDSVFFRRSENRRGLGTAPRSLSLPVSACGSWT